MDLPGFILTSRLRLSEAYINWETGLPPHFTLSHGVWVYQSEIFLFLFYRSG